MGCILGSVACCCGSAACSLCCSACPSCKNSTASRIGYSMMLVLGSVVSIIMLIPGVRTELSKIPWFCKDGDKTSLNVNCDNVVGFLAVYRVCFAMAMFFLLFSIIMIKVSSSKDVRSKIQNGFWFFKFIIMLGICIGAFFIPKGAFGEAWMIIGMIGAFLFIIIQLVLLVDFAHAWAESWVEKYEETESRCYYIGLFAFTIIFYVVSLVAVILFYIYYASGDCSLHKFFVSFNLILCVVVSVIAILPKIQEYQPRSGLLQSSVISMYVIYLTWSAMTNNPDKNCNPNFLGNSTSMSSGYTSSVFDWQGIIALIIFFVAVLYSSIRTSSNSQVGKLTMSERTILQTDTGSSSSSEDTEKGQKCGTMKKRVWHIPTAFITSCCSWLLYMS
uniref:Serine incorporator n=1 Tax=Arion vulgaris TaxID=1028688 RepID=A0A0B7AUE9_9EUPU